MGRHVGAGFTAAILAGLTLAVASPASAVAIAAPASAASSTAVRATLLTRNQVTLSRRFSVRVRVTTRRPGTVRSTLTLADAAAGSGGASASRSLHLRARGTRTLTLPVGAAGRRLLGRCVPLHVTLVLVRGGRVLVRLRRTLDTRGRACGADAEPVAPGFDTSTADHCDPLDGAQCLQPFPNDHFTVKAETPTGRRLAFQAQSMPTNLLGKPIDPADINVSDGFSPGSAAITRVPGLDDPAALTRTGAAPIDDPEASLRTQAPVVVIDTATHRRHLVWAEIDMNPTVPGQRVLLVRPAMNYREGGHYIVALRRLRDAAGRPLPAQRAFRVYRDRIRTTDARVEARRPQLEAIFQDLAQARVPRDDLYLAWDFTVASARSTTHRMLSIRDRAFAELGDTNLADRVVQGRSPAFRINPDLPDDTPEIPGAPVQAADVDGIRNFTKEQDPKIARVIHGTFTVPCYLNSPGCLPGGRFAYGTDKLEPVRTAGNVDNPTFTCIIPRQALDGTAAQQPLRPNLYGHGLFGSQGEIMQGQQKSFAQEQGFLPCATDWEGMATTDVPTALAALQDLSLFPLVIDHVQQGFLNQLFLGRLLLHPDGFASNPAFRRDGRPLMDTHRLFYDGNSQGGIYGGALTAIAPDYERAALGVVGMNYSTLLPRSVDFDQYAKAEFGGVDSPVGGLYDNYPDQAQRSLVFGLLQLMWDRGDPDGYAQHMTGDPLPNTPTHEVLMHVGFGDHQVSDVTAEVQARTIGARIHRPVLEPGRPRFRDRPAGAGPAPAPFEGLGSLGRPGYSAGGSGIVFWDIGPQRQEGGVDKGVAPPPFNDVPNRLGKDPHEAPRNTVNGRRQKSLFLRDGGRIVDVCSGPCFAFDYKGGAPQP